MKNKAKNETEEKMDLLDEDTQNNLYKIIKKTKEQEDEKYDDIDTIYEQYRIEDIDFISQSSNEDIESKMNKMIQIKKKGGNLQDYFHNREMSKLQQMKLVANNFQEQKIKKQKEKKEEKIMKMKKGLEKIKIIYPKIMRNIAYRKLTKKMKYNFCIQYGFEKFSKFYNIRTRNIKKNNYNKFLKYSKENKIKKKKEKEEKEKKEKMEKEKQEKQKQEKQKKQKQKQEKQKIEKLEKII